MAPSSKHIHQILTRYHFTLSRKSNIGLTQLAPSAHSGQKYQIWAMKIYIDYSQVLNKRVGWNKRGGCNKRAGWKFF